MRRVERRERREREGQTKRLMAQEATGGKNLQRKIQ